MSYIYRIFEGKLDLLLTTRTLIYPNEEVYVKAPFFPISSNKEEINKNNEFWQFTFLIECFGQNLKELAEYIEDDYKGFIDFISVYNESTGSEKLSVQFSIKLEKLKYL